MLKKVETTQDVKNAPWPVHIFGEALQKCYDGKL